MPPQQFLFKRKINELLSPHLGALSLQVHLYFHQRLIEPRDTVDRRIHINKHTHAYNHLMIIFLVYYKFWFVYQLQWFGLVLTKYQQHYSTPSPVSTEMGDRASTAVVGWCLLSQATQFGRRRSIRKPTDSRHSQQLFLSYRTKFFSTS